MPVDLIYPNDEISSDFPMILSTGRLLEHWPTGTMTRRALVLDELEPVPIIFINETDSKFYDLDLARDITIETRRGKIKIKLDMTMTFFLVCYFYHFVLRKLQQIF